MAMESLVIKYYFFCLHLFPTGGQGGTTRPLILRIVKEVTESEDGDKSLKQEVILKRK